MVLCPGNVRKRSILIVVLSLAYADINLLHQDITFWTKNGINVKCPVICTAPVREKNLLWTALPLKKQMKIKETLR